MNAINLNFATFTITKATWASRTVKQFEGFHPITDSYAFADLYLNEEEGYYYDDSGNSVELTKEEAETGIGTINIDNEYKTTYTVKSNELDEEGLEIIINTSSIPDEFKIETLLTNGYSEVTEDDFYTFEIDGKFFEIL